MGRNLAGIYKNGSKGIQKLGIRRCELRCWFRIGLKGTAFAMVLTNLTVQQQR